MIRTTFKILLINYSGFNNHSIGLFRYVRNLARRSNGPKFVEGKVKTVTCYDETERIENYQELMHNIKKSKLGDELDVEKHFTEEGDLGHIAERCDKFYDMHLRENKIQKSIIKKNIIKRKYFNLDKETNVLSYAAKEQIRFLHKSNPLEWNYKAIAKCFPISEAGVKKLLKSNFTLTCSEKIKAHDEEVAKKWAILKSGKYSTFIAPLTQKLYKEGKLVDDYFSGNPNLPTASPSENVIFLKKNEEVGEFSAIVQTYKRFKEQRLLEMGNENHSENNVAIKSSSEIEINNKSNIKAVRKFRYAHEEFDDDDDNNDMKVSAFYRKKQMNYVDLPLSEFKEMLKEETGFKLPNKYEFHNILSNTSKSKISSKTDYDQQRYFVKIAKYDKENKINVMYDTKNNVKRVYKYDDKLGYQHPIGKIRKRNIQIPSKLYRKGKLYKLGQCVYDDKGKFLYEVPS